MNDEQSGSGRFAYEGLDRAMHEKARLGLLTCLAGAPKGLTFVELKQLCDLTDGNLNRHLKQLSDGGLVRIRRREGDGRPQTTCSLTAAGRKKFADYLSELERVLQDAQNRVASAKSNRPGRFASDH